MRKYQPIWDKVKKEGKARISTPSHNHKRLINAVRKEKAEDTAWKLVQLEQGKRYKLLETIEDRVITFELIEDTSTYISDLLL